MSIEPLPTDTDFGFDPMSDTLDIQASPAKWIFLALLLDNRDFLSFATTTTDSSFSINDDLKYFLTTGIHQIPEEIRKDRATIETKLNHWVHQFQLKPISIADLELIQSASSGTYLLYEGEDPSHVVKPVDEDILALNNPFSPGIPGGAIRARDNIPLYESVQRECAAYQLSRRLGFNLVPPTSMAAIESSHFHDMTDAFRKGRWDPILHLCRMEKQGAEFIKNCGHPSSLKLCSLRDYVPHATTLGRFEERYSLDDVDPNDVIAANLLMWVFGNTDGHWGNVLVYPKAVQESGRPLYGLKLIDLCLTLPESNDHLLNMLPDTFLYVDFLPAWAREWIATFPLDDVIEICHRYELTNTVDALKERVRALQLFAREEMTIEEIDTRLKYLGESREAALAVDKTFELPRFHDSTETTTTTPLFSWLRV